MKTVISLGAGVQSSTMALMAKHGEISPMPDCAVFADTQGEPKAVYAWLDWLEKQLPFPIHRVTRGSLETEMLRVRTSKKTGMTYEKHSIPAFIQHPVRGPGILGRHCTLDFKIIPIQRFVRKWKKQGISMWIGISLDEVRRMKDSREPWIKHSWPLIDKRMTRQDCLGWMAKNNYPTPPRSACVFCPYHNNREWNNLKVNYPEEFAHAVSVEKRLQTTISQIPRIEGVPFLHNTHVPLELVDFKQEKEPDLFDNECEGICGV